MLEMNTRLTSLGVQSLTCSVVVLCTPLHAVHHTQFHFNRKAVWDARRAQCAVIRLQPHDDWLPRLYTLTCRTEVVELGRSAGRPGRLSKVGMELSGRADNAARKRRASAPDRLAENRLPTSRVLQCIHYFFKMLMHCSDGVRSSSARLKEARVSSHEKAGSMRPSVDVQIHGLADFRISLRSPVPLPLPRSKGKRKRKPKRKRTRKREQKPNPQSNLKRTRK